MLTDPAGTRVVEQNYQYDLVSSEKLLERYVGEKIAVEQQKGNEVERISGTLLSAQGGSLILQRDNGEVLSLSNYSNVSFPSLPGGLITKPTLVWLVNAKRAGSHDTRVSYQTQGMTWWTDYNISLRESGDNCAMIFPLVSIVNQARQLSVRAIENWLLARSTVASCRAAWRQMVKLACCSGRGANQALLNPPCSKPLVTHSVGAATSSRHSTSSLSFSDGGECRCKKHWLHRRAAALSHWRNRSPTKVTCDIDRTVGAYLEFDNKEANQLGVALPAGRMRVNQASADGTLEFIARCHPAHATQ